MSTHNYRAFDEDLFLSYLTNNDLVRVFKPIEFNKQCYYLCLCVSEENGFWRLKYGLYTKTFCVYFSLLKICLERHTQEYLTYT